MGFPLEGHETGNEVPVAGTPEDVAVLYSWANLHGAKYRDFSASRREYRAQIRYRAAQALRERELKAQTAAEASAVAAERAALAAESAARAQNSDDSQVQRLQALRNAEAAARKAAAERMEASRRADAAAQAEAIAQREEREIAEAHASAQRQALSYEKSDLRRRRLAGPQPHGSLTSEPNARYGSGFVSTDVTLEEGIEEGEHDAPQFLHSGRYRPPHEEATASPSSLNLSREPVPLWRPQGYRPDDASGVWQIGVPQSGEEVAGPSAPSEPEHLSSTSSEKEIAANPAPPIASEVSSQEDLLDPDLGRATMGRALERVASGRFHAPGSSPPQSEPVPETPFHFDPDEDRAGPAWLYAPQTPPSRPRVGQTLSQSYGGDTLQDSRERVASRWFALKGVFGQAAPELPTMQPGRVAEPGTPVLLIFSLAGGVGKTSLAATLGRALSSQGEKVVLTDTTSHGLLPFYFGARELRPGVVRTFSPPAESANAPISMVSYDVAGRANDERRQEALTDEIFRNAYGNQRVILDLSASASWLIRRTANLHPTVLVPVTPDMNSVISLQAVEKFFQGIVDSGGRTLLPFYLLNQFDATLPLHLDVREVFRRQLGERLLNFVIRRSPAVSEALAEGMTVIDYAPGAPVSKDYLDIAEWLRSVSPASAAGIRNLRWSDR